MRRTLVVAVLGACSAFSGSSLAQVPPASAASGAPDQPTPVPPTPAPPAAPVEPTPATAPAPADVEPASPAAPPATGAAVAPRVKWVDAPPSASDAATAEEANEGETVAADAGAPLGWKLGGSHFVLSFERLTSLLSWRNTTKVESPSGVGGITTTDVTASGTDVSFLSAGAGRTVSSVPRVAFDGVANGGFTFGGYLGYLVSSGKNEATSSRGEVELPDQSLLVVGGRLGYLIDTSGTVGFWLRGGFSRSSLGASTSSTSANGTTTTSEVSLSAWNLTLDPQLVLVPAPRFAITLGPLLDFALAGTSTVKTGSQSVENEYQASAFGVTAGASAIF